MKNLSNRFFYLCGDIVVFIAMGGVISSAAFFTVGKLLGAV